MDLKFRSLLWAAYTYFRAREGQFWRILRKAAWFHGVEIHDPATLPLRAYTARYGKMQPVCCHKVDLR